jgi:competence protein ComFB
MTVTNTLEEVVPATVDRLVADRKHIRSCEACHDDVVALALSTLEPGYASTELGRILKRIDVDGAKGHTRVTVAVLAAIAVVEQNPHHVT